MKGINFLKIFKIIFLFINGLTRQPKKNMAIIRILYFLLFGVDTFNEKFLSGWKQKKSIEIQLENEERRKQNREINKFKI